MEDKDRFDRNLTGLAETFEKEVSEFLVLVYQRALEPFGDAEIERAMITAAMTLRWFPKPVELIEIIRGKSEERALLAWDQLLKAIRLHGSYQSILFGDGRISRAVELMGGWLEVCSMMEDETKFRMADFMKIYAGVGSCSPTVLMGRIEQENRLKGFDEWIPDPVVIGASDLMQLESAGES